MYFIYVLVNCEEMKREREGLRKWKDTGYDQSAQY